MSPKRANAPDTLARIEALVNPPAWTDVWICLFDSGHIQAVGTDDAGRKQYRHRDEWRRKRNLAKSLDANGTITFDYIAKSGKQRVQAVADPEVCEVVTALLAREDDDNPELLAFRDGDGHWVDVKSRAINAYLAEASGGAAVSAKDFRTWSATVLCAVALAVSESAATIAEDMEALGQGSPDGHLTTHGETEIAVLALLRSPQAVRAASRRRRLIEAAELRAAKRVKTVPQATSTPGAAGRAA